MNLINGFSSALVMGSVDVSIEIHGYVISTKIDPILVENSTVQKAQIKEVGNSQIV